MEKNIKIAIGVVMGIAVIGVGAYFILQEPEKPSTEQANLILDKAVEKTLALDSFTTTGDASFQIKDGEIVLFGVTVRDAEMSIINPLDLVTQDLSMTVIYDVAINFESIAGLAEAGMHPEELEELRAGPMGIDLLERMRGIGEANISVTTEMRYIDFDSYMKIVEVVGLREIITAAIGPFVAEMAMTEIESSLGIWYKASATPEMIKKTTAMSEKMNKLFSSLFNAYYIREILPNTEVNGIPAYNFALGIDLEKIKDAVIPFVTIIAEANGATEIEIKGIEANIVMLWPKITKEIEAIEIDFRYYICQETYFIIKETGKVNISPTNLIEIINMLPLLSEVEMTQADMVEFERMKKALRNISIVMAMDFVYSDHNMVPVITPPAEYQVIE